MPIFGQFGQKRKGFEWIDALKLLSQNNRRFILTADMLYNTTATRIFYWSIINGTLWTIKFFTSSAFKIKKEKISLSNISHL